jgi:hypothetical protein
MATKHLFKDRGLLRSFELSAYLGGFSQPCLAKLARQSGFPAPVQVTRGSEEDPMSASVEDLAAQIRDVPLRLNPLMDELEERLAATAPGDFGPPSMRAQNLQARYILGDFTHEEYEAPETTL